MRIASGQFRNMPIVSPDGQKTRPTPEKTRQAVFNSLAQHVVGSHVLDIFAGTGAVGIEALSWGAASCVFVESDFDAIKALQQNLAELKRRAASQSLACPESSLVRKSFPFCLPELRNRPPFGLVWMDPPYAEAVGHVRDHFAALVALLEPNGILAVESEARDIPELEKIDLTPHPDMKIRNAKSYGRTGVTTWTKIG